MKKNFFTMTFDNVNLDFDHSGDRVPLVSSSVGL